MNPWPLVWSRSSQGFQREASGIWKEKQVIINLARIGQCFQ